MTETSPGTLSDWSTLKARAKLTRGTLLAEMLGTVDFQTVSCYVTEVYSPQSIS